MSFSMAPLLMRSADVPAHARDALRASESDPDRRDDHLMSAARVLNQELAIDCADARELVGLPAGAC
jgi:hypothetical protein